MLKNAFFGTLGFDMIAYFYWVLEGLDYYPFGMMVPNRNGSANSYRYGFQGQEKDDEIKGKGNSLNYIFRMHDPRIGRFFAIDPLTKDYPWYTPYSFSGNKVIAFTELEGMEERSMHPAGPTDIVEGAFREIFGARLSDLNAARKDAKSGEEKSKIAKEQKKVLANTEKATKGVQKATYVTAGIGASPFVLGGIAEAGAAGLLQQGGSYLWSQGANVVTGEIAGYRLLWQGIKTRPLLTSAIAAYGIANNSVSQYTANGHVWGDVNWMEAGFSALPGKASTVLGEGLNFSWNKRNEGIKYDFTSKQALISIGGGLFSNYFSDKTEGYLDGEKGGWFIGEFFKFQVETTTNIDPDEIINATSGK